MVIDNIHEKQGSRFSAAKYNEFNGRFLWILISTPFSGGAKMHKYCGNE